VSKIDTVSEKMALGGRFDWSWWNKKLCPCLASHLFFASRI